LRQKLMRSRWLNGSFFAAIHSIVHFGYLYRSSSAMSKEIASELMIEQAFFHKKAVLAFGTVVS